MWSLTFPSPISTTDSAISIERGFQSKFSSKHASELVQCGVAVPFKSVPISHNVPFTVYEERERLVAGRGSFFGPRHRITS